MNNDIFSVVLECLEKVKSVDLKKVNGESRIYQDIGLESIDVVDLIFELEQKYDLMIDLPDFYESMDKIPGSNRSDMSVGRLVLFLETQIEK